MGLVAYTRRNGRREAIFDAIAAHLDNDINDKFRTFEQFDLDHPYTSMLGVGLLADITTNGGEFTSQSMDAALSNDGVAEASLKEFVSEIYDPLAETNDALFNWADITMEAGKGAASSVAGETSDGNIVYGMFDLGSYVTEGLTDIEEHVTSFVTGEGWKDSGPEWYDGLGSGESESISEQKDYNDSSESGVENGSNTTEPTETVNENVEDGGENANVQIPTSEYEGHDAIYAGDIGGKDQILENYDNSALREMLEQDYPEADTFIVDHPEGDRVYIEGEGVPEGTSVHIDNIYEDALDGALGNETR